ncbi:S-adenosylmethionine uptake transporter [Labrys wisconsinensis]|uniref:S-adenosylmethionine uptake transporter n=2 Tax=Labrys wisconsinensis TaxID=425677 RepID=A0ABU0JH60_9HYPH|nr:S-adenosylmethionine uptake transporter [Labrys wisconsinensis]
MMVAGLGVAIMSCMDALMKLVTATYPIGQVVGLRYGFGALFAVIAFLALGGATPGWPAVRRNLWRAVVVLCTATCFFVAIARLPLAEAIALTFMAPLLMALLGRLILKEPVAPRAMVALAVGLVGVIVIARGQESGASHAFDPIGLVAALACAFFYALSMVLMRQQSAKDSTMTIVVLSNAWAMLLALPVMAVQWQPLTRAHLMVFVIAGLLGTCGHLCLAWAYSRAHAGKLGILEYSAFLWAVTFGFLFFSEIPTLWTIAGAVMIMIACLFGATGKAKVA